MKATIKIWKGEHTGGTKFYRVFAIEIEGAAMGVQVNQWGPLQAGDAPMPIHGGQLKFLSRKTGELEWEASRTRTAKAKPHGEDRGRYLFEPVYSTEYTDPAEFSRALKSIFHERTANAVEAMIGHVPSAEPSGRSDDAKPIFHEPVVAPPVIEVEPSRPDEWASW